MLFIDFENRKRLRINGTARIEAASSTTPAYQEAQFVMQIRVREIFPNCPRYIHKMQLMERSQFVPRDAIKTPVPGWKRSDWACDVLAAGDPALQHEDR